MTTDQMIDAVTEQRVRPEDTPDALAFYRAIEAVPDDPNLRAVFADWLEERGGTEPCRTCGGTGGTSATGYEGEQCPRCSGAGYVPDRTLRLARGYRALGEYEVWCHRSSDGMFTWFDPWSELNVAGPRRDGLPQVWFLGLASHVNLNPLCDAWWKDYLTRRDAEDAAALAWCAMTDEQREACDRELRGAQLTSTGELT